MNYYLVDIHFRGWRAGSSDVYLVKANNVDEAIQKCKDSDISKGCYTIDGDLFCKENELENPHFLYERE